MASREPTATEWAVLALVAEGRTHGFALVRLLARGGEVGAVWSVPRPLVYRALELHEQEGAITDVGTEPSSTGPPRRLFEVTPAGAERVGWWLREPVGHVRDARSELLLKLLFLHRVGGDPAPLARAQTERFTAQLASMQAKLQAAGGFERTALRWRIASTRAAVDFLTELT